jgi:lipopolysaccharide export system permease protein
MVSLFNCYIIKHVLSSTAMVLAVMLALVFFTTLLGEFQDIGRGDYTFMQAVIYVALRLPHNLYLFCPMLILLGGIIGLGMLTSHQELMVIRSSGFSLQRIMIAILYSALLLIIIMMLLGEGLAPQLDHKAALRKQNAENNGQVVATASGVWLHEGNDFFHVDRVMPHKHLEGITRYQFDANHQLIAAYHAKSMDFQHDKWFLQDVVKTVFLPQVGTQSSYSPQDIWGFTLSPSLLNVGLVAPEEMSLSHLFTFSRHLVENGLQASQFQLAFWQRVLQPFAIIVMIFLALPFVLNVPRSTMLGLRLLLGVVVGFIFYLSNALLGQLSVIFQFPPFLAASLPIILFSCLCYGVLRRVR